MPAMLRSQQCAFRSPSFLFVYTFLLCLVRSCHCFLAPSSPFDPSRSRLSTSLAERRQKGPEGGFSGVLPDLPPMDEETAARQRERRRARSPSSSPFAEDFDPDSEPDPFDVSAEKQRLLSSPLSKRAKMKLRDLDEVQKDRWMRDRLRVIEGKVEARLKREKLKSALKKARLSRLRQWQEAARVRAEETDWQNAKLSFGDFNLTGHTAAALLQYGIQTPTSIQAAAMPVIGQGRNAIIHSETGSGKTLAYLLPLLHRMNENEKKFKHGKKKREAERLERQQVVAEVLARGGLKASLEESYRRELRSLQDPQETEGRNKPQMQTLIITPTRELAIQVASEIRSLEGRDDAVHLVVESEKADVEAIAPAMERSRWMVGTAGNLMMTLTASRMGPLLMKQLDHLVLDEVDRLIEVDSYENPRNAKEAKKARLHPKPGAVLAQAVMAGAKSRMNKVQLVAVSATVSRDLRRALASLVGNRSNWRFDPEIVEPPELRDDKEGGQMGTVRIPKDIKHFYLPLRAGDARTKIDALVSVMKSLKPVKPIVFVESSHSVRSLCMLLHERGVTEAVPLHEALGYVSARRKADVVRREREEQAFLEELGQRDSRAAQSLKGVFGMGSRVGSAEEAFEKHEILDSVFRISPSLQEVVAESAAKKSGGGKDALGGLGSEPSAAAVGGGGEKGTQFKPPLLIADMRAARGLHFHEVDVVFCLGKAEGMTEYKHIAGRTGRQGKAGVVVSLGSYDEMRRFLCWSKRLRIKVHPLDLPKGYRRGVSLAPAVSRQYLRLKMEERNREVEWMEGRFGRDEASYEEFRRRRGKGKREEVEEEEVEEDDGVDYGERRGRGDPMKSLKEADSSAGGGLLKELDGQGRGQVLPSSSSSSSESSFVLDVDAFALEDDEDDQTLSDEEEEEESLLERKGDDEERTGDSEKNKYQQEEKEEEEEVEDKYGKEDLTETEEEGEGEGEENGDENQGSSPNEYADANLLEVVEKEKEKEWEEEGERAEMRETQSANRPQSAASHEESSPLSVSAKHSSEKGAQIEKKTTEHSHRDREAVKSPVHSFALETEESAFSFSSLPYLSSSPVDALSLPPVILGDRQEDDWGLLSEDALAAAEGGGALSEAETRDGDEGPSDVPREEEGKREKGSGGVASLKSSLEDLDSLGHLEAFLSEVSATQAERLVDAATAPIGEADRSGHDAAWAMAEGFLSKRGQVERQMLAQRAAGGDKDAQESLQMLDEMEVEMNPEDPFEGTPAQQKYQDPLNEVIRKKREEREREAQEQSGLRKKPTPQLLPERLIDAELDVERNARLKRTAERLPKFNMGETLHEVQRRELVEKRKQIQRERSSTEEESEAFPLAEYLEDKEAKNRAREMADEIRAELKKSYSEEVLQKIEAENVLPPRKLRKRQPGEIALLQRFHPSLAEAYQRTVTRTDAGLPRRIQPIDRSLPALLGVSESQRQAGLEGEESQVKGTRRDDSSRLSTVDAAVREAEGEERGEEPDEEREGESLFRTAVARLPGRVADKLRPPYLKRRKVELPSDLSSYSVNRRERRAESAGKRAYLVGPPVGGFEGEEGGWVDDESDSLSLGPPLGDLSDEEELESLRELFEGGGAGEKDPWKGEGEEGSLGGKMVLLEERQRDFS